MAQADDVHGLAGVKVLVLGASGLLGRAVRLTLANAGSEVIGTAHSRAGARESGVELQAVNLTEGAEVGSDNLSTPWHFPRLNELLERTQPSVIVNCAAERRPDRVQANPSAAEALNVQLPGALARWCSSRAQTFAEQGEGKGQNEVQPPEEAQKKDFDQEDRSIDQSNSAALFAQGNWAQVPLLIHISTDYVFDGNNPPHTPSSPTNPLNAYGESKARSEQAISINGLSGRTVVLRVPLLYGRVEQWDESAVSVLLNAIRLPRPSGEEQKSTEMDAHQTRYPTCVEDVARAIQQVITLSRLGTSLPPVIHISAQEAMTKYVMSIVLARVWNGARTQAWNRALQAAQQQNDPAPHQSSTLPEQGPKPEDKVQEDPGLYEDDGPAAGTDHLNPLYEADSSAKASRPLNARLDVFSTAKLGISTDCVEFETWWGGYFLEQETAHVAQTLKERIQIAEDSKRAHAEEAERRKREEEEHLAHEAAEAAEAEKLRKQKEDEAEERRKQEEIEVEERRKREEIEAEERRKQEEIEAEERRKQREFEAEERRKQREFEAEERRKQKESDIEQRHNHEETDLEDRRQQEISEAEEQYKQEDAKGERRLAQLQAEAGSGRQEENAERTVQEAGEISQSKKQLHQAQTRGNDDIKEHHTEDHGEKQDSDSDEQYNKGQADTEQPHARQDFAESYSQHPEDPKASQQRHQDGAFIATSLHFPPSIDETARNESTQGPSVESQKVPASHGEDRTLKSGESSDAQVAVAKNLPTDQPSRNVKPPLEPPVQPPLSPLAEPKQAKEKQRTLSQLRPLSPDPSLNSLTAHPTPPETSPLSPPRPGEEDVGVDEDDPRDDAPLGSLIGHRSNNGTTASHPGSSSRAPGTDAPDSDSERYGAPSPRTREAAMTTNPEVKGLSLQKGLASSPSMTRGPHAPVRPPMGENPSRSSNAPRASSLLGPDGKPLKSWYEIKVGDPEMVGTPVSAHTVYTVRTRTDSERFRSVQFSVLRRYRDFRWLHAALVHNHPGVIVPPVPEKVKIGRFNPELVEARRLGLELCINKIANHAILQQDDDFALFLSSDNFAADVRARDLVKGPIPTPEQRTYLGWGTSLVSVAGAGGPRFVETDEWFDKQRLYLDHLETHLKTLVKALHSLSEQRKMRAKAEQDLARHYAALSTSSLSRATCTCFAGVGEAASLCAKHSEAQAEADMRNLGSILHEYERMVGSVRKAFQTREDAWVAYKRSSDELARMVAKRNKLRDEDTGSLLDRRELVAKEAETMQLQNRFEAIGRTCKSEMAHFDHDRLVDIRQAIGTWVQGLISRQRDIVREWEEYAALVERQTGGYHHQQAQRQVQQEQTNGKAPSQQSAPAQAQTQIPTQGQAQFAASTKTRSEAYAPDATAPSQSTREHSDSISSPDADLMGQVGAPESPSKASTKSREGLAALTNAPDKSTEDSAAASATAQQHPSESPAERVSSPQLSSLPVSNTPEPNAAPSGEEREAQKPATSVLASSPV